MNKKTKIMMACLMGLTVFRAQTVLFLSQVQMFGGPAPDAWLPPWFSDALLGFLMPIMVFLLLKRTGPGIWGALLIYNALGAFDYMHGLATQWISPMPTEMADPLSVYLGIGVFLSCQLTVLVMLFRSDVIEHFVRQA